MRRSRCGAALAVAVTTALSAIPADAANDVDQRSETKIVIAVPIDLVGGDDDVAKRWDNAIKDYWNDGPFLGYFKYCGKKVEFKPDFKPIAAGQAGRPDAHKITMRLERPGIRGRSKVRWAGANYDPRANSTGTWSSIIPDSVAGHEFGHLIGLEDEYFYEDRDGNGERDPKEPTRPKPEFRDGSLMAEGNGKVLQRHINEAMQKNGVRGCEEWTGSIDWTITASTIRMSGQFEMKLSHDGRGNVTGEMSGEDPFVKTGGMPCDVVVTRPGTLSANLVGQYTASQNKMSLTMTDRNFVQGTYRINCPGYSGTHRYGGGGPLHQPLLEGLLRNLTVGSDGSVQASREGPVIPETAESILKAELSLRLVEQ